MGVIKVLKHILAHPLAARHKVRAISNFMSFQISKRVDPQVKAYRWIDKLKINAGPGMTGVTGNLYCGLYEYEDMTFLLHFLRPDDLFLDIGANHGVYTLLAAGVAQSKVYAFEPVPNTATHFSNNINLNQLDSLVTLFPFALGESKATMYIRTDLDTMNHISNSSESDNVMQIEVEELDEVLQGECPSLLKIDVEGFEYSVLRGASTMLENSKLKALIIEMNASGEKYGISDEVIEELLTEYGFYAVRYSPETREISRGRRQKGTNEIFIRDESFVVSRLKTASPVHVWSESI